VSTVQSHEVGLDNRIAFSETLVNLAASNPKIVVVVSDRIVIG
jgi:transketolase C-terminal domain/subunit